MTSRPARHLTGPVSQALREEVADLARARGVVIWLDKDSHYTEFVDELVAQHAQREFVYPVVPFRGSFLEQMLALEAYGTHLDNQPLLIHMPGHNEESIRKTPMLEFYEPGYRYRKSLPTLVREVATGLVVPEAIETFVADKDLSLAVADAWVSRMSSTEHTGLAARLNALDFSTLVEHLLGDGRLLASIESQDDVATLREHLRLQSGLDDEWCRFFGVGTTGTPPEHARQLVDALGGWLLCHEFVHDLTREPVMPELRRLRNTTKPLLDRCLRAPKDLRKRHPEGYATLADDIEGRIVAERDAVRPEELGHIDTFRFEEALILEGALLALGRGDWQLAHEWSSERVGDDAFWVGRDLFHNWEWKLVDQFARLGLALDADERPLHESRDLPDALERYTTSAYRVDTAHREFERSFYRPDVRLPDYDRFKGLHRQLRQRYRDWADQLAEDFAKLCEKDGALPDSSLQQRTLYDQVVQPLVAEGGTVAVFLVDAFRYELAARLAAELEGTGTTVRLDGRYAELPTLTSVGMNVVPPVAQAGKLMPVVLRSGKISGFRSGEFTVSTIEQRGRVMASRSGQVTPIKLRDVAKATTQTLKRRLGAQPGVIFVYSTEFDDAGESGHLHDALEGIFQDVRSAWHQLQLAGVRKFVFTADHGFLLQDETTHVQPFGKKTEANRRHILSEHAIGEPGMLTVPFSQLGYEGSEHYLLFRRDTAVFDNGHSEDTFVHGGNSLQERVIPVIVATRKVAVGRNLSKYAVSAKKLAPALGYNRVSVQVDLAMQANASLVFASTAKLELALRVPERSDIHVVVRQPSGAISAEIGGEPVEVFFSLEGAADEQVAVEVYHPANLENVEPARLTWFSVAGQSRPPSGPKPDDDQAQDWDDAIVDEGFRRVFVHIYKHGSISEQEITGLLGKPRRVRAFAAQFDVLVALVPFQVRIESVGVMKRYVKEGSS